jgi:regulatory protein
MAVTRDRNAKVKPALDAAALERAALLYAGRYATTRARLKAYLVRKVRERGWEGRDEPAIDSLVERMAALGYVDDRAFATARASSLSRRGYGGRRIDAALHAAGIAEADSRDAREIASEEAWTAALRFAERRKIGPFAPSQADRAGREKAFAAMLRAGHPVQIAKKILAARPGQIPQADDD